MKPLLRDWKTSAAAAASAVFEGCAIQWPHYQALFHSLSAACLLLFGLVARDTHAPGEAPTQ